MKEGYVDATGVQDLFYEADVLLTELLRAVEAGEKTPEKWMDDPGFALTQANMAERAMDMWGCKLLTERDRAAAGTK
jgi:inositol transport system substrate-binding protein